MTSEQPKDPRQNFVPRFLPWLLGLAALALYLLTLNPWVSLTNSLLVAKISGWTWQPEVTAPLSFLVTYPLHWLAAANVPIVLNFFAAVCAAATLGLLARSVAILPQDRTEAQRKREHSDFSFLTIASAWLPPLLAVVICGLQMTFWEQATNFTGEIFDLLLFAFIIWLLLEYRLDEREWRLYVAAFVHGAGMTDNFAMIGFLPVFIGAVIWLRGLSFFNLRFITRMLLCGLAGLLFYLLLPLINAVSHNTPLTFWETLKYNLSSEWLPVKSFFLNGDFRQKIGLMSLTSLFPVLLLSIRWKSSFGDTSRIGSALTSFIFHLVHGAFFAVCIWVAFDPALSPRHLGFGMPFLTFYYLAALAIGYFCGYLLLVFGKNAALPRTQRRRSSPFKWLNRAIVAGVWIFSAAAIAGLFYKNGPQISLTNSHATQHYARSLVQNLPATGGYALSDDPYQFILTQAMLVREGRAKEYIVLDTSSLAWPQYHRFLHARYQERWPQIVSDTQQSQLNPRGLLGMFNLLSQTNSLYYLNTSYLNPGSSFYFELFYPEPHGLVYKLEILPNDTLLPAPLDQKLIAENNNFWAKTGESEFAAIIKANNPPASDIPQSLGQKILGRFHISTDPNANTALIGGFYAHALNDWGVWLQRANDWTNAANAFALAGKLNPENTAAQINLRFNQDFQSGKGAQEDLAHSLTDPFGKYSSLAAAMKAYGAFDVPSYCFLQGSLLAQASFHRQAIAPMERVTELLPENLPTRLALGQLYLFNQLPDQTLKALQAPLANPAKFGLSDANSTPLNLLAAAAYLQKNNNAHGAELIEAELVRHPENNELFTAAIRAYAAHGLFTNGIRAIERKLATTPDDMELFFNQGYFFLQLKNYDAAVTSFTRVLTVQTNNPNALLNRAIAYLGDNKFDAARADFESLRAVSTNPAQAAFGLAEIGWRQHDTNLAIENYEIYLANNTDTNSAEAQQVIRRLQQLKGQPH